jgi:hypothetical protein
MARLFISHQKIDTYHKVPMRKKLLTWDRNSEFEYERKADHTLAIYYGENFEYTISLVSPVFDQIIRTFSGKTVRVNHCLAEENLEDWLTKNGTRAKTSQYIASVFKHEGCATDGPRRGTIMFR